MKKGAVKHICIGPKMELFCLLLVIVVQYGVVSGDYQCLCNYSVEQPIYATQDTQGHVLGYMYEFDCQAIYSTSEPNTKFLTVQYEKQVGYVEQTSGIQIQSCQGMPPKEDIESTAAAQTSSFTPTAVTTSTTISSTLMTTTPIMTESTLPTTAQSTSTTTIPTPTPESTTWSTTISTTTQESTTWSTTIPTTTQESTKWSTTIPTTTQESTTWSTNKPTTTTTATTTSSTVRLTTPTATTHMPTCHGGWIRHADSCYLLHADDRWTWTQASSFCLTHNAHLVIINSAEENQFLTRQWQHRHIVHNQNHVDATGVWIGATDHDKEGTWVWRDPVNHKDTPMHNQYTHWGPGEPNSDNGHHDQDCAAMIGKDGFRWHDTACSVIKFFTCERSAFYSGFAPSLIG